MKKALIYLTLTDLVFLLILSLSSFFEGITGRILYYSAFLIPLVLALVIKRFDKDGKLTPPRLTIDKEGTVLTLPAVMPTIALVLLLSFLTSLLLGAFGLENSTPDVSGNIFIALLTHALLPAVLEEGLFRYLPLSLITPYSRRAAILYSALFFSLIHCNLFQMPYAFAAGVVFATVDVMANSVLPSFIIHLVNNAASVIWLRNSSSGQFALIYVSVVVVLALLSLIPVLVYRKKYAERISYSFSHECKEKLPFAPLALVVVCVLIAFMSL